MDLDRGWTIEQLAARWSERSRMAWLASQVALRFLTHFYARTSRVSLKHDRSVLGGERLKKRSCRLCVRRRALKKKRWVAGCALLVWTKSHGLARIAGTSAVFGCAAGCTAGRCIFQRNIFATRVAGCTAGRSASHPCAAASPLVASLATV